MKKPLFWAVVAYVITIAIALGARQLPLSWPQAIPPTVQRPVDPPVAVEPGPYAIDPQGVSDYLTYPKVVELLKSWQAQAPEITEFGSYGKNQQGTDLCYLRIGTPGQKRVLITGAIHGNERLGTATVLNIMGEILKDYKHDEDVTWLVKNREIYFVPVFSPESYLRSREIEGVDPNRHWPTPAATSRGPFHLPLPHLPNASNKASPVLAIQAWFTKMNFSAVIDGHTYGRLFIYPSYARGEDLAAYQTLTSEMAKLSGYKPEVAAIQGLAIDFYYSKSAVAIVTEFGPATNEGHDFSTAAIQPEFQKTCKAVLYFIRQAPEIKLNLKQVSEVLPVASQEAIDP
jgi:hypothetical protein